MNKQIALFIYNIAAGAIMTAIAVFFQKIVGTQGAIYWIGGSILYFGMFFLYGKLMLLAPGRLGIWKVATGILIGGVGISLLLGIPILPTWL